MGIYLSRRINGVDILDKEFKLVSELENYKDKKIKCIGILNLMPNKIETERHFLKLLEDINIDVFVKFIRLGTYQSKSISKEYIYENYYLFDEVKYDLDGIIITGAPVEKLEFKDVKYIDELNQIVEYSNKNLKNKLYICWAAQAALNHTYKVRKVINSNKIFGIYSHKIIKEDKILEGVYEGFKSPHSRYTTLETVDIYKCDDVNILSTTYDDYEHIAKGKYNDYYIFGHCEYDKYTLKNEYLRDLKKNHKIDLPKDYFLENNPQKEIVNTWIESSIKIYKNWINCI